MCRLIFNFSQLNFSLPRVGARSDIVMGQSGLNQTVKDMTNFLS